MILPCREIFPGGIPYGIMPRTMDGVRDCEGRNDQAKYPRFDEKKISVPGYATVKKQRTSAHNVITYAAEVYMYGTQKM